MFEFFCSLILSFVGFADTQQVCSYLKEGKLLLNWTLYSRHRGLDSFSIGLTKLQHSRQFSRSYETKMATFDLTDPKVMTVKKGGTTQVLLFSDALKNSSNSAEWKEHELRSAKAIEAIAPIFSKLEELKDKGKDYEPSVYELGSLFQEYNKVLERINKERDSCIHLLKDKYQSERRNVLRCQTSGLEELYKELSLIHISEPTRRS